MLIVRCDDCPFNIFYREDDEIRRCVFGSRVHLGFVEPSGKRYWYFSKECSLDFVKLRNGEIFVPQRYVTEEK